jgi:hypothetical protein
MSPPRNQAATAPFLEDLANGTTTSGTRSTADTAAPADKGQDDANKQQPVSSSTSSGTSTAAGVNSSSNKKKKNDDWPLRSIQEPHDNDVLFGRGGSSQAPARGCLDCGVGFPGLRLSRWLFPKCL